MKRLFSLGLMISVMILLLPGCATIVGKSRYPVAIRSYPDGASITVTNRAGNEIYHGVTPVILNLKASAGYFKREEYEVTYSLEGYESDVAYVTIDMQPWYIGNLPIIGIGLIGIFIIDPLTGRMWKVDQEFLDMRLRPLKKDKV